MIHTGHEQWLDKENIFAGATIVRKFANTSKGRVKYRRSVKY